MLESLADFHFLRPWWLLLLITIPVVVMLQAHYALRSNNWHKVISPVLFDALLEAKPTRKAHVARVIPPLALLCMAFALAGPTYARLPQPVAIKDDPLVIVLDLTLSMTSNDIQPSRIERSKFKISDILTHREEGLTGFVVYAGDAYVVTPLTNDDANILNLLPSLSPEMMPVKGSNAVAALSVANDLFSSIGYESGRILLLTDGISDFANLRNTVDKRYPMSILGVGSPTLQDSTNRAPNLDESLLRDFARVTSGRYQTISKTDSDIAYLLRETTLSSTELLEDQTFDAWHDVGYLLIFPIALLLAMSMRRGGLAVMLLIVGTQIQGGWLQDLWVPKDTQAYAAHEEGNFSVAGELFEDSQWRGVAKYRAGEFTEASELFARNESLTSMYNQGNARAWEGRLDDALKAYDDVLAQIPNHEDALHNKAVIEELMQAMQQQQQGGESGDNAEQDQEDQEQQSQQQNAGQQQSDSSQAQQDAQEQQSAEAQEAQDDEEQAEEKPSQQPQAQDESDGQRDEKSGAQVEESPAERELREIHERWLRRIPDDPSGLLQRKFQAESNARIERGELQQKDLGPAW